MSGFERIVWEADDGDWQKGGNASLGKNDHLNNKDKGFVIFRNMSSTIKVPINIIHALSLILPTIKEVEDDSLADRTD